MVCLKFFVFLYINYYLEYDEIASHRYLWYDQGRLLNVQIGTRVWIEDLLKSNPVNFWNDVFVRVCETGKVFGDSFEHTVWEIIYVVKDINGLGLNLPEQKKNILYFENLFKEAGIPNVLDVVDCFSQRKTKMTSSCFFNMLKDCNRKRPFTCELNVTKRKENKENNLKNK